MLLLPGAQYSVNNVSEMAPGLLIVELAEKRASREFKVGRRLGLDQATQPEPTLEIDGEANADAMTSQFDDFKSSAKKKKTHQGKTPNTDLTSSLLSTDSSTSDGLVLNSSRTVAMYSGPRCRRRCLAVMAFACVVSLVLGLVFRVQIAQAVPTKGVHPFQS